MLIFLIECNLLPFPKYQKGMLHVHKFHEMLFIQNKHANLSVVNKLHIHTHFGINNLATVFYQYLGVFPK